MSVLSSSITSLFGEVLLSSSIALLFSEVLVFLISSSAIFNALVLSSFAVFNVPVFISSEVFYMSLLSDILDATVVSWGFFSI
jgi:hypothetical protein